MSAPDIEGVRYRLERALADRSIQWLANEMAEENVEGTGYSSVYRYVKGEVVPPPPWIAAAADVLDVRYPWLLAGFGPMNDEEERNQREVARAMRDAEPPPDELELAVGAILYHLNIAAWPRPLDEVPTWAPLVLQTAQRLGAARGVELDPATQGLAMTIAQTLKGLGIDPAKDLPRGELDDYVHAQALALKRAIEALLEPPTPEDTGPPMSDADIEGLIERLREWADRIGRDPVGTPCDDVIPAWEALILAADALRRLSEENARLREALEKIAKQGRCTVPTCGCPYAIARAALSRPEEKP